MKQTVDLRGLTCPEPVLRTKKLFDDVAVQSVEALVDDDVCVNNLQRLARTLKAQVAVRQKDGFFQVDIERSSSATAQESARSTGSEQTASADPSTMTVIFIAKDTFGEGDPDFSRNLINVFLQTVMQAGHEPRAILLANTGVKLMAKDSPSLKVLQDFRERGCEVLACGLCVEFYGLKDDIPKEQITNMYAIVEYLFAAGKVLSP